MDCKCYLVRTPYTDFVATNIQRRILKRRQAGALQKTRLKPLRDKVLRRILRGLIDRLSRSEAKAA
jgi:hypothetical protein